MSYQVLARKWRPRDFASLVGQEHVVRALRHALEQKRLHHAYLFTGTRGVGKTTLARILAKCLNCETGITAGALRQVQRLPARSTAGASSTCSRSTPRPTPSVDEMRQLLDTAQYAPTRGRFKVYVIDEVHMLSKPAFNAMLKTLEEPPEHLKFILATTDPQKIPVTVLSRCLQFNLKQMPRRGDRRAPAAAARAEEKIAFEPEALPLIARAAAGSMRDALSLLDQAIAHGGGNVAAGKRARHARRDRRELSAAPARSASPDGDGAPLLAIADEMQIAQPVVRRRARRILRACCSGWRSRTPYPTRWSRRSRARTASSRWRDASTRRRSSSTTRSRCRAAKTCRWRPMSTPASS